MQRHPRGRRIRERGAGTCADFLDNDCDGLTDKADVDCGSAYADLGVTCSLPYITGKPGADCNGGQRFIPSTLEKIRALKQQITERGLNVAIEVDGGVNASNARAVCDAGADVLVACTAIFGQPDYAEAIRALRG